MPFETEVSFGAWVRRRRRDLDLLQKELANRVGCSVTALQKIERDERRPSRGLTERLAECLELPAEQRAAFLQVARGDRMTEQLGSIPHVIAPASEAEQPPEPTRRELPPHPPTLIGREADLAEITLLLQDPQCRLLTLTGPGGIGKTRLATTVAAQQRDVFSQGSVFVALAPLVGRDQVVTAIADALGCILYGTADRAEQLVHYLRDKAILLVLDNLEHLLAEAACADLVSQLVRGTQAPTFLVTSREPLDIQEEWVFDVQGLPMPATAEADDVEASSAAKLFQQRARQARVGYTRSADDNPAVVRICQLVGGVPLGIELAAAWMRSLSCQEIAEEIQRNLDFLATRARDVTERHRSIRAVFNQSWSFLTAEEQRALRRVAVFRGGFTRAAAENVAGASLALLSALVGKSLLRRVANGRYDLHELVRQYALDHLREDDQEQTQTRDRHCQYYATLLQEQGAVFKGPDQVAVVGALMTELANLRQAWDWAADHQRATKISQAADTLFWLYESQSNFREGVPLFGQAAEQLQAAGATASGDGEPARSLALSQVLSYQGFFCFRQGQHPLSRSLLQRSVALLRPLADQGGSDARLALSTAAAFLGIVTYRMGAYEDGRGLLHEGLTLKRELGDRWGAAMCLRQLGLAAYSQGEYTQAHGLLSEALILSRAMGNPWSLAFSLNFLSMAAQAQGEYDQAQRLLEEGLTLSRKLEDRFNIASALHGLGVVNHALGFPNEARRVLEESVTIWREIGDQGSLAHSLNQLGESLLALRQQSEARDRFAEALEVARQAELAPEMLEALLGLVVLRPDDDTDEAALEIALHALANPAGTREARRRADQLRDALEPRLSPQQFQAIQARAKGKQLRALAAPEHVAILLATRSTAQDRGPSMELADAISSGISSPSSTPVASIDDPLRHPDTRLPSGTVTFCFTDIEGSTQLWERHPSAMRASLARHDAIVREAIEAHGGVIFKTVGDGMYAVFTHASDALSAAIAAQRALQTEPWDQTGPLRARIALHTGVAQPRDGDYYGATLNRVARILALGHGAQILISHATHDLVVDDLPQQIRLRDLGTYQLKDLSRPERLFQLLTPDIRADFPPLRAVTSPSIASAQEPAPLLTSKLHIPPPRSQAVLRPHLLARVQSGLQGKLTLVAAPAGYGKTTLISAWAASLAGSSIQLAWVSLDAEDNDPTRFWKYVLAALETIYPTIGTRVGPLLQSSQSPSLEAVVTNLINVIAALPIDAVLVLDDFHLITTPALHAAMAYLLDHLPAQLHLILTTRTDPPLALTRLRSRGELTELRAADLRFSAEETATFLTDVMGLPLSAGDAAALEARTEGWIASLQLAALAMRDRGDLQGFIRSLTGSNRFVVDYLAEEVLDRLPGHLQSFMLQTSILTRLCGPLCDAVLLGTREELLGASDVEALPSPKTIASTPSSYSQLIIEQLERGNLFVVALDDERQWYRYHQLFAEVLRARLTSGTTTAIVTQLHRRAAIWYEQQGLVTDAMHHAIVAGDYERAGELIERHGVRFAVRGHVDTALGWLSALPEALTGSHAGLAVTHAVVLLLANQAQASEARLQDAERCIEASVPPEQAGIVRGRIAATRASLVRFSGDIAQCVELSRRALELLPETEQFWRAPALVNAARAFLVSGDVTPAAEDLVAAMIAPARASGSLFSYLASVTNLARLQTLQGQLRRAAASYAMAAEVAPDDLPQLLNSAVYFFGMGDLLREWNDLDAAEEYLRQGLNVTLGMLNVDADVVLLGYVALARLLLAHGQPDEAFATLETFGQLARERRFAPLILGRAAAARAQLALAHGDTEAAIVWAEASGILPDQEISFLHEAEYITFARVLITRSADGPTRAALPDAATLLNRLLVSADAAGRMRSAVEILALQALAFQLDGNTTAAIAALERALGLAKPEGYVRVFVDEGAPMATLLARIANSRSAAGAYAAGLLSAFGQMSRQLEIGATPERARAVSPGPLAAQTLIEPLSARELEILGLIAEGHSNQAIADTLIIAVSTVKRHINNIYGKLDVQSRTQALARARELHLL